MEIYFFASIWAQDDNDVSDVFFEEEILLALNRIFGFFLK